MVSFLYNTNGGKLSIQLHAGQTKAYDSERRFIFVIAGTQSGKTSFLPIWLDREIRLRGEGDYLAVTSTYDLFKLKFLPEMERYFVHMFGWSYSKSEKTLWKEHKPRMFTRIIMRSADAEGGLESATAKAAVLDECGQDSFRITAWEAVQRRVSLSQGRVLGGTTPYNLGWLKTQVFDKWRKGDKDIGVVQFKSTMNPVFPVEEYNRAKLSLPTWKFEMFYNGEFSRPAGLIYEDFAGAIPSFAIPPAWPRFLGIDFGGVNTAKLWVAQDPVSGLYYAYRESLDGNIPSSEHVENIRKYGENNIIAYGGAKSEVQQRRDYGQAGLVVREPRISDVESGINRVISLMKHKKLYIMDTCTGLIDELGTYSRELNENGEPTEKIKNKNEFHRIDALRYVASGLDKPDDFGGLGKVDDYKSPWK